MPLDVQSSALVHHRPSKAGKVIMLSLKFNQQWLAFKARTGCAYASFFYSILWTTIPKKQLSLFFTYLVVF